MEDVFFATRNLNRSLKPNKTGFVGHYTYQHYVLHKLHSLSVRI